MNPVFFQKLQVLLEEYPNESLIVGGAFGIVLILSWWLRGFEQYRRFRFFEMRLQGARDQAKKLAAKLLEADKKHAELMRLISTNALADQLNSVATDASVLFLDVRRENAALQASLGN